MALRRPHPQEESMLDVDTLGKDFATGEGALTVLDDVTFQVAEREFVAITGPSGSGKSTLLALMAGLDRPTRGSVSIAGTELGALDEDSMSRFRGRHIGVVFQNFQLIPTLTAVENVRVPAELQGDSEAAGRAEKLLERVGLRARLKHYPSQLSGGEMQRVAIARATLTRPQVLLADEPTGNLDSVTGQAILELLRECNEESTLVLVTHNDELARTAQREIRLRDGRIEEIRTP